MKRLLLACLLIFSCAQAAVIDAPLPDPAQEARALALFASFRCVVCESASIAESPAEVASDMRAYIRGEIKAGRSDADIKNALVQRYGDTILMSPPLQTGTVLLWLGPLLVLLLGVGGAALYFRRGGR